MNAAAGDGTASLDKALDVLEAVGAAPQGLSQGELTARLGLPRTTMYRLLAALVGRGMLRRDPQRKVYCLGLRCFELARQAVLVPDLVAAAAGELRTLRDLTGETAYLAALDGHEVMSLERFDGAHSQRSSAALGQRKPVHCTSQGKAILAAMPADRRDALVKELALKPLTPNTITDRRRLQAELKITAARGWSVDEEEIVQGVRCCGAAIVDPAGAVRGAISVAGPAWRLTRERVELLGPEVAEAARRIGAQLGASGSAIGDPEVRAVPGPWAFHGAFPLWHAGENALYWADALAPSIRLFDGAKDAQKLALELPLTAMAFRAGQLLLVNAGGAQIIGSDGRVAAVPAWPTGQTVALCSGTDGDFWAALATDSGCAIGSIDANGRFAVAWRMDEAVQALHWNEATGHLCAAAPGSGTLFAMRPGSASIRRLVTVPKGSGRVSGLAADAQGGLWTALRDGWSVVRTSPEGALDRVVGLPVPCPTDLAFGGKDMNTLYVTTARQSVPLDMLANAPLSGSLLQVQVNL